MKKIYIVCSVWPSTSKNHAGMYYLAKMIKRHSPNSVVLVKIPTRQLGPLNFVYKIVNLFVSLYIYIRSNSEDRLFLMEYLLPMCEQSIIASFLRRKLTVVAIAHSVPSVMKHLYSNEILLEKISYLNSLLVFGDSLKDYLLACGAPKNKVIVTYHYVDFSYYFNERIFNSDRPLNVVCAGNMARDYDKLIDIVGKMPNVRFNICKGRKRNMKNKFSSFSNAFLFDYLKEEELRELMNKSDVSLNLMKDTVGSNVITTSMASGLAMVCSDVGSIRNYINSDNGFLFTNVNDAIDFINHLNEDRQLLLSYQKNVTKMAESLDVSCFVLWIFKFFNSL